MIHHPIGVLTHEGGRHLVEVEVVRLELEGDALVVPGRLEVRLHLQVGRAVGPHLVHADARAKVRRLKKEVRGQTS